MAISAAPSVDRLPRWPLTRAARERLADEIVRVRQELAAMTGQGLEEGILRLPIELGSRRLETLQGVLDRCDVVDDAPSAVIGRRASLRGSDGVEMTYDIVFPGDGDPDKGRVSADSPLGSAILGAQVGDAVEVSAPAGRWSVTVVSVD
jgi:transcription elongation factor GreA